MRERSTPRAVRKRTLFLVFVAALAIRVAALFLLPPADDGDQRLYRLLAVSVAEGNGYVANEAPQTTVHPLLPVLVSIPARLFGDGRTAGIVATLAIGALLPAVAAGFVGAAFGARAGGWAAVLLALEPHHVLASARLEPDLLAATLGFLLSAALHRRRWGWSGVAVGLAYLNRPESVFWLLGAVAFAAWQRASWRGIAAMLLLAAALAAPFALFVHEVEGRWAFSGKDRWQYVLGVHQYRSGGQPLDPARIPELRGEVGSAFEHLASQPGEFVLGYAYRTGILLRNLARQTAWGLLLLVAVAGLVVERRRSREAVAALLVPLATLPVLPLVGTFFRHSQVPAAVVLAAAAIGLAGVHSRRQPEEAPACDAPLTPSSS